MKYLYPHFKSIKRGNGIIEFIGKLRVKSKFPEYTVSILYQGSVMPLVKIIKPQLVEKPPHFYHEDRSLCLYHPKNYKWQSGKLIAKDIIPWTAAWIYFYEVWLKTNFWYGPSVAHNIDSH